MLQDIQECCFGLDVANGKHPSPKIRVVQVPLRLVIQGEPRDRGDESGNDAFPYLQKLTEPETIKMARPAPNMGCGCSGSAPKSAFKSEDSAGQRAAAKGG